MSALLITLHVIVCIALIMIVLLQTGKGADMGAAFGGGSSQTLFGSTGASTFLSKATTIAAVLFMLTSLGLAYMSSHKMTSSIMTDVEVEVPAATETPAPQTDKKSVKEVSSQIMTIPVSQADAPAAQAVTVPLDQTEKPATESEKPVSEETKTE
ncbi:preprotein translocase subunit SecG [Desulfobacterales bacterium HSG17]|nr:preprotein translocase subunit SecG [Desulfobacterales bacterium HSG17]